MQKVSCVIPTCGRKELFRAVDSVIAQEYDGVIEIIIVDDYSQTNSWLDAEKNEKSIMKLSTDKRPITYINLKEQKGACKARNIGWETATGDFVAFLDDDDTWEPTKTKKQVDHILKYPQCNIVICWSHDMRFNQDRINKPPIVVTHEMIIKSFNLSSTSSYMVRRNLLKTWGGFDETLPSAHEYDLAIRYSENGHHIRCVQEQLITQYSSEGQISENWNKKINGIKAIYQKYKSQYSFMDKVKSFGVINLFRVAKIPGVGNKIYKIIIPIKKRYEK